jgi:hypothetical protein
MSVQYCTANERKVAGMISDDDLRRLSDESDRETMETFGPDYVETAMRKTRFSLMRDFLRDLFKPYDRSRTHYIEFRAIHSREKRRPERYWLPLPDVDCPDGSELKQLYRWAFQQQRAGCEIYVGVLPRGEMKGKKDAVYQAGVVWADIDYKVKGEDAAYKAACAFEPDILVWTGNGIHVYRYIAPVIDLTTEARRSFEAALHGIQQKALPGSDSVMDVSRVLRLPGTLNQKDPQNRHEVLTMPRFAIEEIKQSHVA